MKSVPEHSRNKPSVSYTWTPSNASGTFSAASRVRVAFTAQCGSHEGPMSCLCGSLLCLKSEGAGGEFRGAPCSVGCACLDELTEQCLNRQAHPSTPHAGIATPTLQASPTICLVKPTCVQPHPTVLYGHAHPPALTSLPRSSHAHPSRPVTPIRLATPTQPVWSVPSTCPALLPRSGHAYLSVQLRPPCPATPTLSSYIRPLSGAAFLSSHAHPSV